MKFTKIIFKISLITIIIFLFSTLNPISRAEVKSKEYDRNQILSEQCDDIEINKIENGAKSLLDDEHGIFDNLNGNAITDILNGKLDFNIKSISKKIISIFFREINLSVSISVQFLIVGLLISLVRALQNSFSRSEISEIAFFTCYMIIIGVGLKAFTMAHNLAKITIDSMVGFIQSSLPVMFTLMISSNPLNNINFAANFSPTLLFVIQIAAIVIKIFLLPLVLMSAILSTIDNLSDRYRITSLVSLSRNIIKWTMEAMLITFAAICVVQGALFKIASNVGTKTVKFAIGNFVPIVGRALGESMELVMSCTSSIKDALGLFGILIIISIGVIPMLKILSQKLMLHLTAAIIEPISDHKIVSFVNDIASSLTLLFILILITQVIFLISIVLTMSIC